MRLTYMYYLMKNNLEALENLKITEYRQNFGDTMQYQGNIDNWLAAKNALINIQPIPFCHDIVENFLSRREFQIDSDNLRIPHSLYKELRPQYEAFISHMKGAIEFCESAGFSLSKQGFDVKIPPTKNFDEFTKYIDILNKILRQCPYLSVKGEQLEIDSVDVGSVWMKFVVITASASVLLNNLAAIVDKSVKIASHITTYRQQVGEYQMQPVADDLLNSIIENNKRLIEFQTDIAVKELQEELNPKGQQLSPEDVQRLKTSIESLSDLMDKGLEIYASVNSPQEVKDLFPTSDEIKSLPESAKMLTGEVEGDSEE